MGKTNAVPMVAPNKMKTGCYEKNNVSAQKNKAQKSPNQNQVTMSTNGSSKPKPRHHV
ncbi:hypothetical protein Hanom_Chr00s183256g01832421 [Helianthus anomalus]